MKKKIFFFVCFLVALTTDYATAANGLNNAPVQVITYAIDLGDISEMSDAEVNYLLDSTLSTINPEMADNLQCEVSVEVNVGIIKVTGKVSGDCDKVAAAAKKLAQELKEAFT
jgi:hypothetical protein